MHELSLAEEVLRLIEEASVREGFSAVHAIELEFGALAAVDRDAFSFAFEAISQESRSRGAKLTLATIPAEGRCPSCMVVSPVCDRMEPCSNCGHIPLVVSGGTGFRVRSIDVE